MLEEVATLELAVEKAVAALDEGKAQAVAVISVAEYQRGGWMGVFAPEFRQLAALGIVPRINSGVSFRTFTKDLITERGTITMFAIVYLKEGESI